MAKNGDKTVFLLADTVYYNLNALHKLHKRLGALASNIEGIIAVPELLNQGPPLLNCAALLARQWEVSELVNGPFLLWSLRKAHHGRPCRLLCTYIGGGDN